jgi:[acyl-carrier-protein] S-malonyltransferase
MGGPGDGACAEGGGGGTVGCGTFAAEKRLWLGRGCRMLGYSSFIMKKIALLFAGQGAQVVGMGRDLAENYASVAALYERADEVLGFDISDISFDGPEEILTKTVYCQPALYVHGLACLRALNDLVGDLNVVAAAGLSLGEFTAHASAGTFDFETGLQLVAQRATFMQEACENTDGAMAAMLGADEAAVRDLAAQTDVDVANLNSPGQVVISGEATKIALAISLAKEAGVRRAAPLNVAGAYHSRLMKSAYEKLGAVLEETPIGIPRFPVICNIDAQPVVDAAAIREALREQVTGTVRWTESVEYLIDHEKVELLVELGPGRVVAGLVGRIRKDFPILSIGDVASLTAAAEQLKAS